MSDVSLSSPYWRFHKDLNPYDYHYIIDKWNAEFMVLINS